MREREREGGRESECEIEGREGGIEIEKDACDRVGGRERGEVERESE